MADLLTNGIKFDDYEGYDVMIHISYRRLLRTSSKASLKQIAEPSYPLKIIYFHTQPCFNGTVIILKVRFVQVFRFMYNEANITDSIDRLRKHRWFIEYIGYSLFFQLKGSMYTPALYTSVSELFTNERGCLVGMTRYGFGSSEFESLFLTVDYGTCGTVIGYVIHSWNFFISAILQIQSSILQFCEVDQSVGRNIV
ncbi:hypothetical protein YC2023_012633 [Brassica napus]